MKKWEYRVISDKALFCHRYGECTEIDDFGEEGWELVSVVVDTKS